MKKIDWPKRWETCDEQIRLVQPEIGFR